MRIAPSLLAALAALSFPAAAAAAPPVNDNYLASTAIGLPRTELVTTVDTTEATLQADIFQPNADGQPLGGGPAEPATCNGVPFGKTVWYDLAPPTDYGPAAAGRRRLPGADRDLRVERADVADHQDGDLQRQRDRRGPDPDA